MAFDLTVHHTIKGEHGDGGGFRVTPYNLITNGTHRVYAQAGQFWDEEGKVIEMEDAPDFAIAALASYNDAMLISLGFPPKPAAKTTSPPLTKKAM